ncbi:hypothetical protein [Nocardia yamanashiensis]|uniref:hypothetical protein n=1 Tax=Nocardia yamanashiensis TaxID=209247 RepID=UPI00082F2D52|nr:hypothetical protein [Nocardia yamanashiensis]
MYLSLLFFVGAVPYVGAVMWWVLAAPVLAFVALVVVAGLVVLMAGSERAGRARWLVRELLSVLRRGGRR